jgi:hypothetical protein
MSREKIERAIENFKECKLDLEIAENAFAVSKEWIDAALEEHIEEGIDIPVDLITESYWGDYVDKKILFEIIGSTPNEKNFSRFVKPKTIEIYCPYCKNKEKITYNTKAKYNDDKWNRKHCSKCGNGTLEDYK